MIGSKQEKVEAWKNKKRIRHDRHPDGNRAARRLKKFPPKMQTSTG